MSLAWIGGRIVQPAEIAIDARDRAFQHGIGLFETFRAWGGRVPLWERHLARMTASAKALGLEFPARSEERPTRADAEALARAVGGDAGLRMVLTGGVPGEPGSSRLWITARSTDNPADRAADAAAAAGYRLAASPIRIGPDDPLAGHKTLNYWSRAIAFDSRSPDVDEVLIAGGDGLFREGSRTSLLVASNGELRASRLDGSVLPGVARGLTLEWARAEGIPIRETPGFTIDELDAADELIATNATRGPAAARRWNGRDLPAPGPIAARLAALWRERVVGFGPDPGIGAKSEA